MVRLLLRTRLGLSIMVERSGMLLSWRNISYPNDYNDICVWENHIRNLSSV